MNKEYTKKLLRHLKEAGYSNSEIDLIIKKYLDKQRELDIWFEDVIEYDGDI